LLVAQDALEAGGYTVVPVQLASEALEVLDSRIGELPGQQNQLMSAFHPLRTLAATAMLRR
jgi:hypothetical protein